MAEHLMSWTTLAAGIAMLFAIAGPYSNRPISEKLLLHALTISMLGIALIWIVHTYDRQHYQVSVYVAYVTLLVTRVEILILVPYVMWHWMVGDSDMKVST